MKNALRINYPVLNCLAISYNGLLEPLPHSQLLPYMMGIAKKGVSFTLLTFEKKELKRSNQKLINKYSRLLRDAGINWHRLPYHKKPSLLATLFDILCGSLLSVFLIVKNKINIVHSRGTVAATIGWISSKICNAKFIFDLRGLMAEEFVDAGLWRRGSFKYKLSSLIEKRALKAADYVVVLTEKIRKMFDDDFLNLNKKLKMEVIPCCVDLNKFINSKEKIYSENEQIKNKCVLIYVGSLGTWYLLDEMVDFFCSLHRCIENAFFLIITQSDKNSLKKSLISRGIHDNYLIASASPDDIPKYISSAQVGISFTKPGLSKIARSPTKIGEYLACGLPIVVNNGIGDLDELINRENVGIIVNNFNSHSYDKSAKKLIDLFNDNSLSKRCRKTAEKYFSLELGIDKYFRIYNKLSDSELK